MMLPPVKMNLLHFIKHFSRHSKSSSSTTSVQHLPGWCDGSHIAPAYWWRGDSVMKPISVWRWLGGHDGQKPKGEFGQDAGVTPLLFFEAHPGICNDHRESGPRYNVSSKGLCIFVTFFFFYSIVSPSLYWGVRTHTDHRMSTPCWFH